MILKLVKRYSIVGFVISILASHTTWSQTKTSAASKKQSPNDSAIKAAEPPALSGFQANDIWNVDIYQKDDHKILVIQDRKYTKAKRLELGFHTGVYSSSPFLSTTTFGFNSTYYFSEYLGIEGFFSQNWSTSTADKDQLQEFLDKAAFSSTKEFQEPHNFGGLAVVWAPIYGKFAFFRKAIIHFDMYSELGASVFNSTTNVSAEQGGKDQSHWGSLAGVGMRFFLTKHWSTRIDIRHNAYKAEFAPRGPASNPGDPVTIWRQNFQFTLGGSFIL